MKHPVFYQAPNARTGDVIPKYIDGTYQVFYLKNAVATFSSFTAAPETYGF